MLLAGAELENVVADHACLQALIGALVSLQDATDQAEPLYRRGQLAAGHPGSPGALGCIQNCRSAQCKVQST